MLVNACMWLADLATASKHYQIWESHHQLIVSWCPYKEKHKGKQSNMCLSLVCTCSILADSYECQSTCNLALARYFTKLFDVFPVQSPHLTAIQKTSEYYCSVHLHLGCQLLVSMAHHMEAQATNWLSSLADLSLHLHVESTIRSDYASQILEVVNWFQLYHLYLYWEGLAVILEQAGA